MTTKITEQNISQLANAGVNWQAVKTGNFTAVAGEGYFVDTTSTAITVTLPASPSAGDVVVLKDYARTWGTNAVTIASTTFDGDSNNPSFSTQGQTVTLVYMDGTKGWSLINEDTTSGLGAEYITATGGTVTESGDFKIHTFTGDGCFVVSSIGNPIGGGSTVDYLVVAGGGGAGTGSNVDTQSSGGGGGAGGFREAKDSTIASPHTASPLAATTGLTVTATSFPITVGAGGAGGIQCGPFTSGFVGSYGSNSVFSTITSTGGGKGARGGPSPGGDGGPGGSGGGAGASNCTSGSGNTPPVSPPQGNNGSNGASDAGGGGGGATVAASNATNQNGADGGAGATTSIDGSPTTFAGGGGGAGETTKGCGGAGGGGDGYTNGSNGPGSGVSGTANTGGGGGAAHSNANPNPTSAGAGGSGIVIIRYKYQN